MSFSCSLQSNIFFSNDISIFLGGFCLHVEDFGREGVDGVQVAALWELHLWVSITFVGYFFGRGNTGISIYQLIESPVRAYGCAGAGLFGCI